jgi:phosphatidylglycerophosphate synthase
MRPTDEAPASRDDGIVSRYANRLLARPVARALSATPVTANAVTVFTLLLACATGAMVAAGWYIAGGILIQVVSVLDAVDGELARLKGVATRFGAVLDSVVDRYADAAVIAGMTIYAVRFEDQAHAETVGVLALAGALVVSYSRARIEASLPEAAAMVEGRESDGAMGGAAVVDRLTGRDVRLLIAAVGTVVGQCYWTLVVLAVLAGVTIAWRLLYLRVRGIGTQPVG